MTPPDFTAVHLAVLNGKERAMVKGAQKATPSPWRQAKQEYDSHDEMTREVGMAISRGGHVLHYLVVDGTLFPAFTGNGPSSAANAAHLVASQPLATLQLLHALAEARMALRQAAVVLKELGTCDDPDCSCLEPRCEQALRQVRAALARGEE